MVGMVDGSTPQGFQSTALSVGGGSDLDARRSTPSPTFASIRHRSRPTTTYPTAFRYSLPLARAHPQVASGRVRRAVGRHRCRPDGRAGTLPLRADPAAMESSRAPAGRCHPLPSVHQLLAQAVNKASRWMRRCPTSITMPGNANSTASSVDPHDPRTVPHPGGGSGTSPDRGLSSTCRGGHRILIVTRHRRYITPGGHVRRVTRLCEHDKVPDLVLDYLDHLVLGAEDLDLGGKLQWHHSVTRRCGSGNRAEVLSGLDVLRLVGRSASRRGVSLAL